MSQTEGEKKCWLCLDSRPSWPEFRYTEVQQLSWLGEVRGFDFPHLRMSFLRGLEGKTWDENSFKVPSFARSVCFMHENQVKRCNESSKLQSRNTEETSASEWCQCLIIEVSPVDVRRREENRRAISILAQCDHIADILLRVILG